MTAGLPGTPRGASKLYQRALCAILITTIAVAPVHAQDSGVHSNEAVASPYIEVAPVHEVPATSSDAPSPETTPAPTGDAPPVESAPAASLDQVIYKGIVGNILEAVPLDPEQRVQLQRGNAIINNAFAGRSLAMLLGIASPPLMVAGLIWGIWSATRIKPAQAVPAPTAIQSAAPQVHAQEATPKVEQTVMLPAGDDASSEPPRIAAQ